MWSVDGLFVSVVVDECDEAFVTILCLCGQQFVHVQESDEVLVTILCLCGQQFACVQGDVVKCTIGTCDHHFVDLFAGLLAFEAGVAWPQSCASS